MFASINLLSYEIRAYDLLNVVSTLVLLIFNVVEAERLGIAGVYSSLLSSRTSNYLKPVFIFLETTMFSIIIYALPPLIIGRSFASLFHNFTYGTSAIMYFGWLISYITLCFVCAFLTGLKPFQRLDLFTPAFPLALTYSKLACFCGGCCRGFQTPYGFYNYQKGLREFPVQIIESVEALVIFLILMKIRKKVKMGTMFPLYLMLYSGTRFFSEFLRREPNVLGYIKFAQMFCIIFFLLGLFGFYFTKRYGTIIDATFVSFYSKIEDRLLKKFRNESI